MPSSAKATARGSPTYPSTTNPTLMRISVGRRLLCAGGLLAFLLLALGPVASRLTVRGLLLVLGLVAADDVVDVGAAGGRGGHEAERLAAGGGDVADHGRRVDTEQLLEPIDVVGADRERHRPAVALDRAHRPVWALVDPVGDRR